jgi:hypothetical protein
MTKNEIWLKETTAVFYGILLYSIAGILNSIISPIESFYSGLDTLSSFGTGEGLSGSNALTVFTYLLSIGIIAGYIMFLLGLNGFARILEPNDGAAVGKIRTGVILGLIATGVGFIPFTGWIVGIINIVAFILMLIGYSTLKSSQTFPVGARKGAGTLFTAQILLLIGAVIGLIPLVGGIVEGILDLIAFILVFVGWAAIKNTKPEEPVFSMPSTPVQR